MNICGTLVEQIRSKLREIISLRNQFTLKNDGSYVSDGDLLVQSIVSDWVKDKLPGYELISEEMVSFETSHWNYKNSYIFLDPIDGTENFVSGMREWGVGISVYTDGKHTQSCIYLPELDDLQITGMPILKFSSRIYGLSSSLSKVNLQDLPRKGFEFRIIGCSMYNTLAAARGTFAVFENVNGVNCWDILPGLNLALEHGCKVFVDGLSYNGEILFPTKKYKIKISNL